METKKSHKWPSANCRIRKTNGIIWLKYERTPWVSPKQRAENLQVIFPLREVWGKSKNSKPPKPEVQIFRAGKDRLSS